MKIEKLQQRTQKYKRSLDTAMSNYMAIKWTTWKKMDKFVEQYNPPKLSQEEIKNKTKQNKKQLLPDPSQARKSKL